MEPENSQETDTRTEPETNEFSPYTNTLFL
jgi:hypothetical protein